MLLVRDAPCSTGLVEKAHAAGALTRRLHQQYSDRRLAIHSMLVQLAPMFHKHQADLKVDALRAKLEALEAKKFSDRPKDVFLGQLCREVPNLRDKQQENELRRMVVARSGELYQGLSEGEKDMLPRRAAEQKLERGGSASGKAGHPRGARWFAATLAVTPRALQGGSECRRRGPLQRRGARTVHRV